MVLRGQPVDDVPWRSRDGCDNARGRHVSALAARHANERIIPQFRRVRPHRAVLRARNCAAHILYHHRHCCEPGHMDISQALRRRWICA